MRDLKYMKRWRGYLAQVQAYQTITRRSRPDKQIGNSGISITGGGANAMAQLIEKLAHGTVND